MELTIRDEAMSSLEDIKMQMMLMQGPTCLVLCMDERNGEVEAALAPMTQGGMVLATAGGFVCNSEEAIRNAIEEGYRSFVFLSHKAGHDHKGCGAAMFVEKAIVEKKELPEPLSNIVKSFEEHVCVTHEAVEENSPKVQEEYVKKIAKGMGIELLDQNIITRCIETPKSQLPAGSPIDLIVTSELLCPRSELQIPEDGVARKMYMVHNHLSMKSLEADIEIAVTAVNAGRIVFVPQSQNEVRTMEMLANSVRAMPSVIERGVVVKDPVSVADRFGPWIHQQKPSDVPRSRARI